MWKLNVRRFVDVFGLSVNEQPGDTSILLKPLQNYARYDPALIAEDPPDRSVGARYDQGKRQGPNRVSDLDCW